jgi:hypothetical protein
VLRNTIDIPDVEYTCYISTNRIFISEHTMTISTSKAVYRYDHNGKLLQTIQHSIGTEIGKFGVGDGAASGLLCGIDINNSHLYIDTDNDRLQVCDGDGQWSIITLPWGISSPYDVIVDQSNGVIWLSCDGKTYKLLFNIC